MTTPLTKTDNKPGQKEEVLVAAHDQLAELTTQLRPYTSTDLSDAVTRAHYYLLRARATLNDAIEKERKEEIK